MRSIAVTVLTLLAAPLAAQTSAGAPPPPVCAATPANRQFDFWIGRWDVAPWNSPPLTPPAAAGTSVVEADIAHCVVNEHWRGANGSEGKSINFFDVNRRAWRQLWVASGGGSLDYSGEFRDGTMRFEGWTLGANGRKVLQRLTFTPYGKDTVRQSFFTSSDEGASWTPGFDARYVRREAQPARPGTYRSPTGSTLRLLLSDANVGPEVSMGEITFPPNADSGDHQHGAIEVLYVLSGELEHSVNGKSELLKPGMVGYVTPPDKIRHKTGAAGAKVLVVWVPGDEANRIIARWKLEP